MLEIKRKYLLYDDLDIQIFCIHCGSVNIKFHRKGEYEHHRMKCNDCNKTFSPQSDYEKKFMKESVINLAQGIYTPEHREFIKAMLNINVSSGVVLSNNSIARLVGCSRQTVKNWLDANDKPIVKPTTGRKRSRRVGGECREGSSRQCKYCDGKNVIKYGKPNNIQRYRCKDCGGQYDVHDYSMYGLQSFVELLNKLFGPREYYACHYLADRNHFRRCQFAYKCPYSQECAQYYSCPMVDECPYPDSKDCPYARRCRYIEEYSEELKLATEYDIVASKEN